MLVALHKQYVCLVQKSILEPKKTIISDYIQSDAKLNFLLCCSSLFNNFQATVKLDLIHGHIYLHFKTRLSFFYLGCSTKATQTLNKTIWPSGAGSMNQFQVQSRGGRKSSLKTLYCNVVQRDEIIRFILLLD